MGPLLAVLVAAAGQPLTPPPPPPPTPPPVVDAPPMVEAQPSAEPLPGVPQRTRVHVTLLGVPAGSELYDVARTRSLCRAPCGIWLETDVERTYQVVGEGVSPSTEFRFADFKPDAAVEVGYVPRDDGLFAIGLALTIFGGAGLAIAVVSAVIWLVVIGFINLFVFAFGGTGFIGLFEFLYVAAVAAPVGAPALGVGIPLLIKSRARLDVHEARPVSETPAGR
ncbi:MAG: hypothetical protein JNK82_40265 [Myxococcaceae bacterium]|nr:hypothetical protein [Myxococcaceae bacterium]